MKRGQMVQGVLKVAVLLTSASGLPIVAAATGSTAGNTKAIEDFGIDHGQITDSGFLFNEGTYVDSPYRVECRGLDIYINNVLVREGPQWPPRDRRVLQDPGPPPPGSSPLDFDVEGKKPWENYWPRKWVYLAMHMEFGKAVEEMASLYRQCGAFKEVALDPDTPGRIIVTDLAGRKSPISLSFSPEDFQWPPDKAKALAIAKMGQAHYASLLRADVLLSFAGSNEMIANDDSALAILEILISETSNEAKYKMMVSRGILKKPSGAISAMLATKLRASPQLAERVAALRAKNAEQERRKAMEPILDQIRASPLTRVEDLEKYPAQPFPKRASVTSPAPPTSPVPHVPPPTSSGGIPTSTWLGIAISGLLVAAVVVTVRGVRKRRAAQGSSASDKAR